MTPVLVTRDIGQVPIFSRKDAETQGTQEKALRETFVVEFWRWISEAGD
jgi:hypothetical protein